MTSDISVIVWNVNGIRSKLSSLGPSLTAMGLPDLVFILESKLPARFEASCIEKAIPG